MIYVLKTSKGVNSEAYLNERLEVFFRNTKSDEDQKKVKNVITSLPKVEKITEDEAIQDHLSYAQKFVEVRLPLRENEQIKEERLCYCTLEANDHLDAEPMLFLRQLTNQAEILINVEASKVSEEVFEEETIEAQTRGIGGIALGVVSSIGGAILEQAQAKLIFEVNKYLGISNVPAYFEEVYAEMERIIHKAFLKSDLKELTDLGTIFGENLKIYAAHRNQTTKNDAFSSAKKSALAMVVKSQSISNNLGAFHYASASFYHLSMLIEMANKEDEENREEPNKNISRFALDASEELVKMRDGLVQSRLNKIEEVKWWPSGLDLNNKREVLNGLKCGPYFGFYPPRYIPNESPNDGTTTEPMIWTISGNRFLDTENGYWIFLSFEPWISLNELDTAYSWKWVNQKRNSYRKFIAQETRQKIQILIEASNKLHDIGTLYSKTFLELPGYAIARYLAANDKNIYLRGTDDQIYHRTTTGWKVIYSGCFVKYIEAYKETLSIVGTDDKVYYLNGSTFTEYGGYASAKTIGLGDTRTYIIGTDDKIYYQDANSNSSWTVVNASFRGIDITVCNNKAYFIGTDYLVYCLTKEGALSQIKSDPTAKSIDSNNKEVFILDNSDCTHIYNTESSSWTKMNKFKNAQTVAANSGKLIYALGNNGRVYGASRI